MQVAVARRELAAGRVGGGGFVFFRNWVRGRSLCHIAILLLLCLPKSLSGVANNPDSISKESNELSLIFFTLYSGTVKFGVLFFNLEVRLDCDKQSFTT